MNYSLLRELIQYVEEYEEKRTSDQISDFTIWLNNQLFTSTEDDDKHSNHDSLLIAFKVMQLNKALKKETKSILLKSKVSSLDEYSFLLHLDYQDSFRKMEIVDLHNLEAPTGIEIIKRLLRNDFIEEFSDEEDRRARRIKITAKGRDELMTIKPQIESVFNQFTEAINLSEKIQISGILDKLIEQ